jgi:hypothetical protein
MSLGPGWWLRNTPTPQTPREPSQSNNVNENKYSIVQQPGHIHLPGLAQKPQQHIIPVRKSQYPIQNVETGSYTRWFENTETGSGTR